MSVYQATRNITLLFQCIQCSSFVCVKKILCRLGGLHTLMYKMLLLAGKGGMHDAWLCIKLFFFLFTYSLDFNKDYRTTSDLLVWIEFPTTFNLSCFNLGYCTSLQKKTRCWIIY